MGRMPGYRACNPSGTKSKRIEGIYRMKGTDHRSPAVRNIALLLFFALPLAVMAQRTQPDASAGRRRAAAHSPVGGTVTLTGTITDSATGAPIPEVEVVVGDKKVITDDQGAFKFPDLLAGTATVTFQRWGYHDETRSLTLVAGSVVNLSLAPKPVDIVKDTHGNTFRADYELSQFGYTVLFGNLGKGDAIELCKSGGEHVIVDKSTIAKISGPATSTTSAPCCTLGPVLNLNLTLKSGEALTGAIVDSCYSDEVFAARDRDTRQWVYLKFTDIAEIDFP
jgi:hypothetical protein